MPKSLVLKAVVLLVLFFLAAWPARAQGAGASNPALVAKLESPDARVQAVAFSPDGRLLAAGYGFYDEGGVTIWRLADRAVVAEPLGRRRRAGVRRVEFSKDGKLFAAATHHGDVLLWTVGNWRSPQTVLRRRGSTTDFSFSPDATRLALATEQSVILYDIPAGRAETVATAGGSGQLFRGVSFTPDGKFVVVSGGGAVRVWDVGARATAKVFEPAATSFFGRLAPDGGHVVSGGGAIYGGKAVEIRSFPEGRKLRTLEEFRGGLFTVAISHAGALFAVAGGDYGGDGEGSLSLWHLAEGRELGFASFGDSPIQGLAFSPDDALLAAASTDGFVLLYAVERLRGPEVKRQERALCGEVAFEGERAFVVPVAKVPTPMSTDFEFAWKLEVADAKALSGAAGAPVALEEWAVESGAGHHRARVEGWRPLLPRAARAENLREHVVFGDTRNPGWDESFVLKVYGDGSFLATDNAGKCLAYGHLGQLGTDFRTLRARLVGAGLLGLPVEPLVLGADHYRTRFIELGTGGAREVRSDADSVKVLLEGGPARKREAFRRIFGAEEDFLSKLLRAGLRPPQD